MFNYEYKERDYATEIIKNGFTSNHVKHELKILVKYYKEQGHKPKERKEMIYAFCEKYLDGYNRVTHFKMINSILNYGSNKKNVLVQIDNIGVTNEELKYIDELNTEHDYKKLLFTVLVLDKLNKEYNRIKGENIVEEFYFGGDYNYKKLIKYSNVKLKNNNQIHKIVHELSDEGLVDIKMKSSIKLSFMYDIPKDDSISLTINTFDNIGLHYDLHAGVDKVKQCECCGTPIKIKNNKNKYCLKCAKDKEKIRKREWKRNSGSEIEKR